MLETDRTPTPRPLSLKQKFGLGVVLVACLAWYASSDPTPQSSSRNSGNSGSRAVDYTPATPDGARAACQTFVRRLAHDPSSIEWVNPTGWSAYPEPEQAGRWFVRGFARGRTPAGGLRLGPIGCTLSYYGADSRWELVDITQDP